MADPVTGPEQGPISVGTSHEVRLRLKLPWQGHVSRIGKFQNAQGSRGFTVALGICMRGISCFAKCSADHRSELHMPKQEIVGPEEAFEDIGVS